MDDPRPGHGVRRRRVPSAVRSRRAVRRRRAARSRPVMAGCVAVLGVCLAAVLPRPAGASTEPLVPVAGTIVDPFRPPPHPYGPGNRGVELATRPGAPVLAPVTGRVSFAGRVAGTRAVTVLDATTGRRYSVTFLAEVVVRRGDLVRRGQRLGAAGAVTHVGVRDASGAYLDPMVVFAPRGARLVPGGDDGAGLVAPGVATGTAVAATAARLTAGAALARHGADP